MTPQEHAQRWKWFLDIVFGAIVALSIQKYDPVVREAWQHGPGAFAASLFVAFSICSFVVYDVVAYNALVSKLGYTLSPMGFVRFYLDLVMAFVLYVLLNAALRIDPDWVLILSTISVWHLAAVLWHLLALREHKKLDEAGEPVMSHALFVILYWTVAFVATAVGEQVFRLAGPALARLVLLTVAGTILMVSIFRLNRVVRSNG